ncbi:phosphotransferase family protein [Kineococcus sp. TBRC 1896]|uniref:Phosphotransferase family protein n=1 Tax=Kineococcus mangrovi TaxID=1660183 RepID=A0ABV4I7F0_9ACTN
MVERERPALAPLLDVLRVRIEERAEALRREVPCLSQNDANFHNIIVGDDGVTLIDWDFPAVRYPLEELAGLEGHAYLYGFPELPPAFFDGYGLPVSAPLLRLHRIVGDLGTLSSPGWAHMISGSDDLTPPVLAMVRRFYSGWSAWFDDLHEHIQGT